VDSPAKVETPQKETQIEITPKQTEAEAKKETNTYRTTGEHSTKT
jgi:hypothetical protein